MIPTLESAAASLRTSNMLVPLVLGDLTDELARRRTRGGDGPSIAWQLGHILDFRCQLITLLGTPRQSPFRVAFATSSATDGADYPTVAEFRQHWQRIEADLDAALEDASEATVRRNVESGGVPRWPAGTRRRRLLRVPRGVPRGRARGHPQDPRAAGAGGAGDGAGGRAGAMTPLGRRPVESTRRA